MDTRASRFPLVDAMRASAALAILLFHAAGYAGAFSVPVLKDLTIDLQSGVTLFFLISGFLLYRPFVAARIDGRPLPHVGAYAWRRFLRIVPAYWAVLTVVGLFIDSRVFEGDKALIYYGYAQVYDTSTVLGGLAVAWTLCVEVAFYALLPLYALGMRAVPGRDETARYWCELAGLAALAAIALAFRITALQGGWRVLGSPTLTLPAFLDWFALGMGLAVLSVWLRDRPGLPRPLRWLDARPGVAWLVAGAAYVASAFAANRLADRSTIESVSVHVLWGIVALGLLLPAVIGERERGAVRSLMAGRTLAWLGLVSYGIYLWQLPVMHLLGDLTQLPTPGIGDTSLLWPVVAPPLVFAVAALSYYGLERPALSLKRLVSPPGVTPDQPGAVSAPAAPVRTAPPSPPR